MKYEIGSFSVDGECGAFVMIGTSSSCRHLYYHLFIVALGVMRQFVFSPFQAHKRTEWTLYDTSNPL